MRAVELEKRGKVGVVRLRKPERANALDRSLLRDLLELQKNLQSDDRIQLLITTGEGKGFCGGSDLYELADLSARKSVEIQRLEASVCRNFLRLPQPSIAAVHGYAFGGGLFLAAHHDFRILASSARLGLPEVRLGWNPTFGMQRLIQVAGLTAATLWLMTGSEFRLSDARCQSFANIVVAKDSDVFPSALDFAESLAALPSPGLSAIKEALWQETGKKLKQSDSRECRLFGRCLATAEARSTLRRYKKSR